MALALPIYAVAASAADAARTISVMGTLATVEVAADSAGHAASAAEAVVQILEASEARLSTWGDSSELARFNRCRVGEKFACSPETLRDLRDARGWGKATGSAFESAIGPLVRAWNLRGVEAKPSADEIACALERCGPSAWRIADGWLARTKDCEIEEGGFGKGAALRAALERAILMAGVREVWLNLGGQVARFAKTGERRVEIAHPLRRDRSAAVLPLANGSIATSGTSERGKHIIDPRIGRLAPSWGSMTVYHPDALAADALSTALFVMGPVEAIRWADAHPPVQAAALEVRGDEVVLHTSNGWRDSVHACAISISATAADAISRTTEGKTK